MGYTLVHAVTTKVKLNAISRGILIENILNMVRRPLFVTNAAKVLYFRHHLMPMFANTKSSKIQMKSHFLIKFKIQKCPKVVLWYI